MIGPIPYIRYSCDPGVPRGGDSTVKVKDSFPSTEPAATSHFRRVGSEQGPSSAVKESASSCVLGSYCTHSGKRFMFDFGLILFLFSDVVICRIVIWCQSCVS